MSEKGLNVETSSSGSLARWFKFDQFEPESAVTSNFVSPLVLAVIRGIIFIYSFVALWIDVANAIINNQMSTYFCFFTHLTFIGLISYQAVGYSPKRLGTALYHSIYYLCTPFPHKPASFTNQHWLFTYLYWVLYDTVVTFKYHLGPRRFLGTALRPADPQRRQLVAVVRQRIRPRPDLRDDADRRSPEPHASHYEALSFRFRHHPILHVRNLDYSRDSWLLGLPLPFLEPRPYRGGVVPRRGGISDTLLPWPSVHPPAAGLHWVEGKRDVRGEAHRHDPADDPGGAGVS
ncbi:hypothetical protein BC938DRAFT_472922 [Jimgerdemannia flammicorona]|uniref:Uncharacterized protein n=1 Tax=Jimgerdemannia flammicorona TaxID=994334 RepID=A0A433Q551_9FUNG|nr:hypothetical protein BC938DRAFT_472922 [Jimgerdemannia flammicorona]